MGVGRHTCSCCTRNIMEYLEAVSKLFEDGSGARMYQWMQFTELIKVKLKFVTLTCHTTFQTRLVLFRENDAP